tara:strand:- start:340 stop:1650 length:1311 start_codon:yes stop_codon:yes gene_type:complete
MQKVNDMFTELYLSPLSGGDLSFTGNEISATRSNEDLVLKPSGTGSVSFPAIRINDNNIEGTRSNENINLVPNGTGSVVFGAIKFRGTTLSSDDSTIININDGLVVDGTLDVSGASTLTGAVNLSSTLQVPSGLTTLSTLSVTSTTNLTTTNIDNLTLQDNTISSSSNADINLTPGGTGSVVIQNLTIDSNINITDNEIKTTSSNSDLVIAPAGTGQVVIAKADINGGTIDNAVIGATTPLAGTFTTLNTTSALTIDGVTIDDNTISTNSSNANLELTGNGTGTVMISGFGFPTSDGSANQVLKTDGSGNLGFVTLSSPSTLNHSEIGDNTATVATSATSLVDSWSSASYRSAKYHISISDATNSRFEIAEVSLIHGPSADSTTEAFLTVFGNTGSYSAPLCTFTAEIDDGNVRLLATNITSDSCVFKFQRTLIDL